MPSFNDYFANMGQNALSGALSTRDALNERRDIQNRMSLQGQLPQMINQFGVGSRNMSEEQKQANKQYLSLLASTNPEEAVKYLMQANRESGQFRNIEAISQAIKNGLQASRVGQAILEQAKTADKTELPQIRNAYNEQYDLWRDSLVSASQAQATSEQLNSIGKLPTFDEFLRGEQKQINYAEIQKINLRIAELQEKKAQAELDNQPILAKKYEQDLVNAQAEGVSKQANAGVASTEAQKKAGERPVLLGKLRAGINTLVSYAKDLNSPNAKLANSSANLLLTSAGKAIMGALSNDEFVNLTGNKSSNLQNLINKYNPFATMTSATPDIAWAQGKKIYDSMIEEYNSIYNTFSPQEKAMVKGSVSPWVAFGQSGGITSESAETTTRNGKKYSKDSKGNWVLVK